MLLEASGQLQVRDVVMREGFRFHRLAVGRNTLEPKKTFFLRLPDDAQFHDGFPWCAPGRRTSRGGITSAAADQGVIEKLLQLHGRDAQEIHVRQFRNFFLAHVRSSFSDQQVRR